MFTLPGTPQDPNGRHEIADFAEIIALRHGICSERDIIAAMGRAQENDYADDGVPEDDPVDIQVREALTEIEERGRRVSHYPFYLDERGVVREDTAVQEDTRLIYAFLLFATRLQMNKNRRLAGVDATELFENLSAEVAREYFGGRSRSIVFGTARGSDGFLSALRSLNSQWGEQTEVSADAEQYGARYKDDGVDVVVWTPFNDGSPGKLIGYGQCKTGTNYRITRDQRRPEAFNKLWFSPAPLSQPVRLFFVAEALPRDFHTWNHEIASGVILFDRTRILDCVGGVDESLTEKLRRWTDRAQEMISSTI